MPSCYPAAGLLRGRQFRPSASGSSPDSLEVLPQRVITLSLYFQLFCKQVTPRWQAREIGSLYSRTKNTILRTTEYQWVHVQITSRHCNFRKYFAFHRTTAAFLSQTHLSRVVVNKGVKLKCKRLKATYLHKIFSKTMQF